MPWLLLAVYVAFVVVLLAAATFTLGLMAYAWRTPRAHKSIGFANHANNDPCHSFSIIVPARHEGNVIEETLSKLVRLKHPDFEVLLVVGDDDPAMISVGERAVRRWPDVVRVVVDDVVPKSKPRALNAALPHCRGDVVGVFDAEDDVHPLLLERVDREFQVSGADVVQGGVQLMDFWSGWYSVANVLEYFFWFRSRLHFHADYRFVPLGGNTVFIRNDLLLDAGGWDEDCLAEDCELGIRLSADGARVSVCYEPELVTREETPDSLGSLMRQRTRWNQGFLQVLRKGEWKRLPERPQRFLAAITLGLPFLQGVVAVFLPIAVATIFLVKVPIGIALLSFLPLIPTVATVALQLVGLSDFGDTYGVAPRWADYGRVVLGIIPYQLVLAYSAGRAVWRESWGNRGWEKTSHSGRHRDAKSTVETEVVVDLTGHPSTQAREALISRIEDHG
jgi:cellulose synthase/poly-beta-1,6-N-acetylglucosamine synthase-like glycosyltransferase